MVFQGSVKSLCPNIPRVAYAWPLALALRLLKTEVQRRAFIEVRPQVMRVETPMPPNAMTWQVQRMYDCLWEKRM